MTYTRMFKRAGTDFICNNKFYIAVSICMTAAVEGVPIPHKLMAEELGFSESWIEHISSRLRAAGITKARRGHGGGIVLTREPEKILLSQIMLAVSDSDPPGPAAQYVDRKVIRMLGRISLADIVRQAG